MSHELNQLLTLDELRDYLKVSRATIFRLKDQGMPSVKLGGSLRFDPAEVQKWIQAQAAETQIQRGEFVWVPRVTSVIWEEIGGRWIANYGSGRAVVEREPAGWSYAITDAAKQKPNCFGVKATDQEARTLCSDVLVQWAQDARRAELEQQTGGYRVSEEG